MTLACPLCGSEGPAGRVPDDWGNLGFCGHPWHKHRMVILVCGGRTWRRLEPLETALERALQEHGGALLVVHGAAKGADAMALAWCERRKVMYQAFPAAWGEHHTRWCPGDWCLHREGRDYCIGAGPRRNQTMVEYLVQARTIGRQVKVLAFKEGFDHDLRKGGTEDMVRRAEDESFPVYLHDGVGWKHISHEQPELPF